MGCKIDIWKIGFGREGEGGWKIWICSMTQKSKTRNLPLRSFSGKQGDILPNLPS